jgi:hypothetical protein
MLVDSLLRGAHEIGDFNEGVLLAVEAVAALDHVPLLLRQTVQDPGDVYADLLAGAPGSPTARTAIG